MFGSNIKKKRTGLNMTLSELANRCGISIGYLSDIENGIKRNPSLEILHRISKALGIEMKDLITDEEIYAKYRWPAELTEQEVMWGLLIKAAENNPDIKKSIEHAINNEKNEFKLSSIIVFVTDNEGVNRKVEYNFKDNKVYYLDDDGFRINLDGSLNITKTGRKRYTAAAHKDNGYDDDLTDEEQDAVKAFIEAYRKTRGK